MQGANNKGADQTAQMLISDCFETLHVLRPWLGDVQCF